jgi:hypothetical protein
MRFAKKMAEFEQRGKSLMLLAAGLFALALLAVVPVSTALAEKKLPEVRAGEHENYSRLVFDWGRMVGYRAERNGNVIDVIFAAQSDAMIPEAQFRAKALRGISAARQVPTAPEKAALTHFRIAVPDGVKHRDFRIGQDLVVFDFYSDKPMKVIAPPKKTAAKPAKIMEKPAKKPPQPTEETEAGAVTAVTEAPPAMPQQVPKQTTVTGNAAATEAQQETVAEDMPAPSFTASVSAAPPAAAVPATAVETQILPEQGTVITLSTIEPSALAVFERFGGLWLVLDRMSGNIPPQLSGPLAAVLGAPQEFSLPEGTAYRFDMPPETAVAEINKMNLSWLISLHPKRKDGMELQSGQVRRALRAGRKPRAEIFLPGLEKVIALTMPDSGEKLYVVTAKQPGAKVSLPARYPQFAVIPAAQGVVVKAYDDDLQVTLRPSYVEIDTQKGGLVLTQDIAELPVPDMGGIDAAAQQEETAAADDSEASRLFDFYSWQRGGLPYLRENQRLIEAKLANTDKGTESAAVFLEMALLYLANGFGHEAYGALRAALHENPDLDKNPGFLAVRGGASVLAGFYQEAIRDLSVPGLKDHPEARMWRGYAAAASEQWLLAGEMFPNNNKIVARYPPEFAVPFMLYMAESSLRLGDTTRARGLLNALEPLLADMQPHHYAAMQYLAGEEYRQEGEPVKALQTWFKVAGGRNRLYHAKSSLSIVQLLRQIGRITDEDALDRLETLRYAWRGDGLEIQLLHAIASLHLDKQRYIEGLRELRRAVDLSEEILYDSGLLIDDMTKIYSKLYVDGEASKLPAFEAVALYNGFKELMPAGSASIVAEQNYADYLVRMDLLEDAAKIFEKQIAKDLQDPLKIAETGTRLATVYLRDNKAKEALSAIQRSGRKDMPQDLVRRRELLRARALSDLGMTAEAIKVLSGIPTDDAKQLIADIHWRQRDWAKAAATLQNILPSPAALKISGDDGKSNLVLNTAVAYKMADDQTALAQLRSRYLEAMKNAHEGAAFAVVTRPVEGTVTLQDRETILKMAAEVDLFKSFLDNYRMERNN